MNLGLWLPVILAFTAALCWGINAHLVRLGMKGENHFHALFVRSVFSFPILFGIVLIWKGAEGLTVYFQDPIIYYTLISATLILIGDSFFLMGLKKYTVNVMLPITAVYPLFTSITLILTGEERIGILLIIGTIIVISGVVIVTSNDITKTFDLNALVLGVSAALCWGISIYFVRLILKVEYTDAMGLTGLRMLILGFSAILIYRVGNLTGKISNTKEIRDRSSTKYMALSGLFGWVIGASAFFAAVQQIGAGIPTPISSTNPIIASIIGQILGIEQVNRRQFSGIILSVLGIVTIVIS